MPYSTAVSPNDRSEARGSQYFETGLAALACIRRALTVAGAEAPTAVLDLRCGHGQVTRMLRAAFPDAHLTVCDRDADGVDFCAAEFEAEPLYAPEDPSYVTLPASYDLIWCGPLFAALPMARWTRLLGRLANALQPNGVLVLAMGGRATPASAYPAATTMSLALAEIELEPTLRVIGLQEAAWSDLDVLSCIKRTAPADLRVDSTVTEVATPAGNIDNPPDFLRVSGTTIVNGWAIDRRGVREVRIFLDDRLVLARTLTVDRPDVSAAFPQLRFRHDRHGWTTILTFEDTGEHTISAEAENVDGQVVGLGQRRVTVTEVAPVAPVKSLPDPSVLAAVHARPWFYELDLPDGGRTDSYLPDSVKPVHETRLEMMWRALEPVVKGDWRVFTAADIACHQGYFSTHLARKGCRRVVGVDARASHVADARLIARLYGLGNLRIEQHDVRSPTSGTLGLFDIVLVFGLLYHVEDPVGLLRLARGMTRRVCLIETQLSPEGPTSVEWGASDVRHAVKGTLALVDESGDTDGLQANLAPISMCPSLSALRWLMSTVGFSRVEIIEPGPGAYEQFASGARVMAAGYMD
ncbi:MAG: class I SAM-dependent methyltransferase [Vicinamibacterales bacterium]